MSDISIEPFIIDILEKKRKKKRIDEDRRIPLHIYPPDLDGYRDEPKKDSNNKRGYIEIDMFEEEHIIKM